MALKPTTKVQSNKLGTLVTPVGSALFVSVPNASQYDPEKQEASIMLSAEDYAILKAQIDGLIASYEGELVMDASKAKMPIKEATDAEGNLTGEIIVKSKTAMRYPAKLFDAKGVAFNPAPGFQVSNRSKIRLAVSAELVSTSLYKGIVLRLNAVKIVSSTPWTGSNPFGDTQDDGDFAYDAPESFGDTSEDDWTK